MPIERSSGGSSLVDVLDRVLDKGIVIDAWARVALVGIDLTTVEARVVVASIETCLTQTEAVGVFRPLSRPAAEEWSSDERISGNATLRSQIGPARARSAVRSRKRTTTQA